MNPYRIMEPTVKKKLINTGAGNMMEFHSRYYETRLGMIRVEKAMREAERQGTLNSKGWYDNSEGEE